MKKLFFMLLVLFIMYLGLQITFFYFSDEESNLYKINKNDKIFKIKEEASFKSNNNYNYEISIDGVNFNFQIFHDYKKSVKLINDIKYYKDDNYMCILPIFKDEIVIDMICLNNGNYNYYRNIKGMNEKLDDYVKNIENYDISNFIDNNISSKIEGLNVYRDNLIENHYLGLNNYKGLFVISNEFNSTVYNITLFNKDVYNQKVSAYYKNYYIVADYNENNTFNKLKIVDIVDLNTFDIISDYDLSIDSVMYEKGYKLYLNDNDTNNLYEIDLKNKNVIKSTLKNNPKVLLNNEKVIKMNNAGYKYIFELKNNKYDIYREDLKGKGKIYLFTTTSVDNLIFINDYVYFINDNLINVYNDNFGIKKIVEFDELKFNKNLKIYVYNK